MLYISVQQCALRGLDFTGSGRLWNHVDLQRVSTSSLWWKLQTFSVFYILLHLENECEMHPCFCTYINFKKYV